MRKASFFLALLLLILSIWILMEFKPARGVVTGSFTVYTIADTENMDNNPDSNYGSVQKLGCGLTGGESEVEPWFKFNLSDAHSSYGTLNITSAKVYYYVYQVFHSGNCEIKSVDPSNETWLENTITWNNRPTVYGWGEAGEVWIEASEQYYYQPLLSEAQGGNSTRGIPALQDAYDNNRTKTYRLWRGSAHETYFALYSKEYESGTYKAKIVIGYEQEDTGEGEGGSDPVIPNPYYFDLIYHPIADSLVHSYNPNTNFGTEEVSQIQHDEQAGITAYAYFKFDFSMPNYINGHLNEDNTTLNTVFDALKINFYQYCQFIPEDLHPPDWIDWRGHYGVSGIDRGDESWSESSITWNNRPDLTDFASKIYVDSSAWYEYNILDDLEVEIRNSVANETTYTLCHRVNSEIDPFSFSDWRMSEYGDPYIPTIRMRVAVETQMLGDLDRLVFENAHIYFANRISVTPFIAGHLLCAMLFSAIMIPIGFITRKLMITLILTMSLLILFLSWGWLDIGVFVFIFMFTLMTLGVKIKRWLS